MFSLHKLLKLIHYFFQNFLYDGQCPGAYFYAGSSSRPSNDGFLVPDEKGSTQVLKAYRGQNLVLVWFMCLNCWLTGFLNRDIKGVD